ncbi:sensor histidine kinase [Bacillus sp. FJAT-28004]|uniref:sensor histidine kinase n=1 Tax=Bacillus sp. FJAT-28004 TaxID=1679165 RepID=UPI0006B4DC3A|nr:histidine kinase [Bacillus sp. FJAT-28004]
MGKLARVFRNLRFKHKLFISYLFVIIIPLTVLGWYSYVQSKSLLVQQAQLALTDNVAELTDNLDYKFKKYNASIESITFNPSIKAIFNNDYSNYYYMYNDLHTIADPLFNTILFLNDEIKQLTVYTENDMTERRNTILSIKHVVDKPWFNEVMTNGQTNWLKEGDTLFGVRSIIGDQMSSLKNMVYFELDSQKIFDGLVNASSGDYGIVIYDQDGNAIFTHQSGLQPSESIYSAGDNKKVDYRLTFNDSDFIVIRNEIAVTGWTMIFYVPKNAVGIDAKKIVQATILTVSICLVVLLLTIWILSATFVKRIYRLNQKMKQVTRGDLNVEIVVDSNDEIGELTGKFKDMLQSINELINEVYRSKVVQKDAELKALQAQINPHFLYNSLSLINWKAINIEAYDISRITTTLSKFYRTTLNRGQDVISVYDELENTKSYVELQLIMHDNNFDFIYEVDQNVLQFDMIKLILQPIVENAIEHGIDNKREGRGMLRIKADLIDDVIVFMVEDNGPGVSEAVIHTVLGKQSKSYGLFNAQERIRIYFGEEYGITIQSEMGKGTIVEVRIPKYLK